MKAAKFFLTAILSLLVTAVIISGGCMMDTNNANGMDGYVPYEGLKLPNEMQRYLINFKDPDIFAHRITEPGSFQAPAGRERGMYDDDPKGFNDKFFYIQALYRKGLDRMLVEELGLYKYDKEIGAQSVHFAPEDITGWFEKLPRRYFWPSFSMMNLDYIFLRNNMHVERLEGEDLLVFEEAYEAQATEVSGEMWEVIERTWKQVIEVYPGEEDREAWYSGPFPSDDDPPSNALVLLVWFGSSFAPDEIGEDGLELDEPFNEYASGRQKVIDKIIPRMEKEISKKTSLPVKIYTYA